MTANTACIAPQRPVAPRGRPFVQFYLNMRLRWRNWKVRKTGRAYVDLREAMKKDPDYAHSWHCNIAMPLMDASKGMISHSDANRYAAVLMKHLFGVETGPK